MSGDPYDSYLVLELQAQNSAEIPTERPSLLPGTSAISRLHPATSFEDFLNADDDEAFVADLSRSDGSPNTSLESGADFLSELFFEEEDSGSSSQVFDPDFMDDDSHDPSHDPFLDGPSTLLTTESNVPEDVPPPIPVRYDIVCEHAYKSPTLLARRLKYLRQMHIHTELGRADLFDSSNPLVVPILHSPRQPHGLAWKAESGVVGGWADVDRPEPRYSTHFYGRPELLLEEERELIAMTTQRTILTVDQAQRLRLGA
ncbi:hypothetical protein GY45DRAFT_382328 [Cubamyces sp. BRFM 1775]|nr:hypothetical protein GY45DRAFT_382328 [Cubamyces sp. BRFM 1775]